MDIAERVESGGDLSEAEIKQCMVKSFDAVHDSRASAMSIIAAYEVNEALGVSGGPFDSSKFTDKRLARSPGRRDRVAQMPRADKP